MKAISPVRSVRSCYKAVCCISEQSLAIGRTTSTTTATGTSKHHHLHHHHHHSCLDEACTAGALCDMNDCYSKLKELVPSIPQNKSVSQMEILQHVIDYIFDLQIVLEAEEDAVVNAAGVVTSPDVLLAIKTADLTRKFSKEEARLCH